VQHAHGTDLESGLLDALNDPARVACRHGVRLDDRESSFHMNVDYMTGVWAQSVAAASKSKQEKGSPVAFR
jgi:hypothetical protein